MVGLVAKRCPQDGTTYLPSQVACPQCGNGDAADVEVSGSGRVRVWTRIHIAPTRYEDDAPYTVVLVDLDEGLRVMGRLIETNGDPSGARVQVRDVDPDLGPMFKFAGTA